MYHEEGCLECPLQCTSFEAEEVFVRETEAEDTWVEYIKRYLQATRSHNVAKEVKSEER
jgi:hypothetical protein